MEHITTSGSDKNNDNNTNVSSNGAAGDQLQRQEEEMNRMRSSSASPSTLSTASSGSPLVRGSSGSSGKRLPAPTSIAAAQLQRQQLEFANRLMATTQAGASKVHGSRSNKSSSLAPSETAAAASRKLGPANDEAKSFGYNVAKSMAFKAYRFSEFWSANKMRFLNLACLFMTLVCLITILLFTGANNSNNNSEPAGRQQSGSSSSSSSSSRLAVIRMMAARKGQLAGDQETISSEIVDAPSSPFAAADSQPLVRSPTTTATTNEQLGGDDDDADADFSLSAAVESNVPETRRDSKFRRKAANEAAGETPTTQHAGAKASAFNVIKAIERELEGGSGGANNLPDRSSGSGSHQLATGTVELTPPPSSSQVADASSLVDPILSQLFNDMELGPLFKTLKRATGGLPGLNGTKPVIRRSKNGATIIISSSFNASNLLSNDSSASAAAGPLPALLERLLSPMFRSISMKRPAGGDSAATITINGEPVFSASSSLPLGVARFGAATNGPAAEAAFALDPFMAGAPFRMQQSFLEPGGATFGFRSASPLMFGGGGPLSFLGGQPSMSFMSNQAPSSLLSMIMRASAQPNGGLELDSEDSVQQQQQPGGGLGFPSRSIGSIVSSVSVVDGSSSNSNSNKEENNGNSNNNKNDTLTAQASQQHNSTQQTLKTLANGSATAAEANSADSELETLDVSHLIRQSQHPKLSFDNHRQHSPFAAAHNFYPPSRSQRFAATIGSSMMPQMSSMLIFSGGSAADGLPPSRDGGSPFQSLPFGLVPPAGLLSPLMDGALSSPMFSSSPQMVLVGGGDGSPRGGHLNPILRTILGTVMSDLANAPSSAADEPPKRSASNSSSNNTATSPQIKARSSSASSGAANSGPLAVATAAASSGAPNWTTLSAGDLEDEWQGASGDNERWDNEQAAPVSSSSRHLRARHRDEEMDSASMDSSEFITGLQSLDPMAPGSPLASMLERQSSSAADGSAAGGIVSGTIRQTIRGPGMTVERIIEVPPMSSSTSNRAIVQLVAPGVRSQSLSRADFDADSAVAEPNAPAAFAFGRPPGSLLVRSSSAGPKADRLSAMMGDLDFPSAPHLGFISKLLSSDLAGVRRVSGPAAADARGQQEAASFARMGPPPTPIRTRSFLDEDLEEGDSSSSSSSGVVDQSAKPSAAAAAATPLQPAGGWPRIRVASARIRMRPLQVVAEPRAGQDSAQEPVFMAPMHFTMPDNGNGDMANEHPTSGQRHHQGNSNNEHSHKMASSSSFEDTLSSMEDRLNHVLSMASHQAFGATHKPVSLAASDSQAAELNWPAQSSSNNKQESSASVGQGSTSVSSSSSSSAVAARPAIITRSPRPSGQKMAAPGEQQPQPQRHLRQLSAEVKGLDNPFTSPSSPLFGFPASSLMSVASDASAGDSVAAAQPKPTSPRQPRSFTYHSNHELAGSLRAPLQQHSDGHSSPAGDSSSSGSGSGINARSAPFEEEQPFIMGPPAGIVMGRRLDEESADDSGAPAMSSYEQRGGAEHRPPASMLFSNNPTNDHENYRTIVV